MGRFPLLRGILLGAAFAMLILATAVVSYPQTPQETVDQVRIAELEREALRVVDHEGRIIRLEDSVVVIKDDLDSLKWWVRFIGGALALAVLERVLRTSGVLGKTDGMGPVG